MSGFVSTQNYIALHVEHVLYTKHAFNYTRCRMDELALEQKPELPKILVRDTRRREPR